MRHRNAKALQTAPLATPTDELAERVRKIGGTTLRSVGQISKLQTIKDNDETFVRAQDMLRELMKDNEHIASFMRECHKVADVERRSSLRALRSMVLVMAESAIAMGPAMTRFNDALLIKCRI